MRKPKALVVYDGEGTMNWQPIETAPKDGTWILLAGGECDEEGPEGDQSNRIVSGQWTNYLNGETTEWHWQFAWYDGGYSGEYIKPTLWMPIPELPDANP